MCVIVDTNTLAAVFDTSSLKHPEFKPVHDWIFHGTGKVVFGGSKYKQELSKTKYLRIFVEMKKAGLAKGVDDRLVDEDATKVAALIQHADFDDQHIVALLRVSKLRLICSEDKRAHPYFRHKLFFKTVKESPHIYSGIQNADLLTRKNIADICLPADQTTKAQKAALGL